VTKSKIVEISRSRLTKLLAQEEQRFVERHPRSRELAEQSKQHLLAGVPMIWMTRWAGGFPVFVQTGSGSHFVDVDGNRYIDFCLGDTGAMTGHAPPEVTQAIAEQVRRGITYMLPTTDAIWLGDELSKRFGLPYWQFALTATDANRFALRIAREVTERSWVMVFNYCYHGSVDEALISISRGKAIPRRGNIGYAIQPGLTTKVIEFNDLKSLEAMLAKKDIACVLAEPAMTNIGIVSPIEGYHQRLRELTREHGTLLIIDETHTISCGPGGYTAAYGLQPDMLTIGKPIGSGIPSAAYGMTEDVAKRIAGIIDVNNADVGGIGGTLAANALSLTAMRATLEHVLTPKNYEHMIAMADRFVAGVKEVLGELSIPWTIKQLGCRVEYWYRPDPPRNGGEAALAMDHDLDRYLHLFALNRGILMTPFHNMALMAPTTTEADVDAHTQNFREALSVLVK